MQLTEQTIRSASSDLVNQTLQDCFCLEKVDSTNTFLAERRATLKLPALCIAAEQSEPKARLGRAWSSLKDKGLYLSYAFSVNGLPAWEGVPIAVGLAVYEALERLGVQNLNLKWPNDLYVGNKKLAGILVESYPPNFIVIGLGVNLYPCVEYNGAGLIDLLPANNNFSLELLVAELLAALIRLLDTFAKNGLAPLVAKWNTLDMLYNRQVTAKVGETSITGFAKGITPRGALLLMLPDGSTYDCHSAEVTIEK